jgi:hypothetical protein
VEAIIMASIESRLAKLENAAPPVTPGFAEFSRRLPALDETGEYGPDPMLETFAPWLTELGESCNRFRKLAPMERGLADLLCTFNESSDPFAFERYRGRVPGRVLAAIYNERRNWAYGPEVAKKIRFLAGVTDEQGNLLPGYKLDNLNGCINDIAEPTEVIQ